MIFQKRDLSSLARQWPDILFRKVLPLALLCSLVLWQNARQAEKDQGAYPDEVAAGQQSPLLTVD